MCDTEYICQLDPSSVTKAKKELNENPDDRLAAVNAFRAWINEQKHIKCPNTDTIFLLRFLRWSKFSQIRAREKFENYLNLRNVIGNVYADIDTRCSIAEELMNIGYVIMLPIRHPDGSDIIILKVDALSKTKYKYYEYVRVVTALIEHLARQDMFQVHGLKVIIDYVGSNTGDITKFISKENTIMINQWLKSTPVRLKGIYFYNPGLVTEIVLTFLKPLVSRKIIDRISSHDTMESLYHCIPKECLPTEYLPDDYVGPNAGTLEHCKRQTKAILQEKKHHDYLLFKTSDAFRIDLSQKPTETVTQHFRKLNVD